MYQISDNCMRFDIKRYFADISNISQLIHPAWPFLKGELKTKQLDKLLRHIEKSLSLDHDEKLRIFNTELMDWQVKSLIKVFKDEKNKFKKLAKTERESVFELAVTAYHDWKYRLLPTLLEGPCNVDETEKLSPVSTLMSVDSAYTSVSLGSNDWHTFRSLTDPDEVLPDIDDLFGTPELHDGFNDDQLQYETLLDSCDQGNENGQALLEALMAADSDYTDDSQ